LTKAIADKFKKNVADVVGVYHIRDEETLVELEDDDQVLHLQQDDKLQVEFK